MLTKDQLKKLETSLQEERTRLAEVVREFDEKRATSLLEDTGELTLYRQHQADVGSEMMEQEQQFSVASGETRRLDEIDEALRRLYAEPESVGVCARCGQDIPMNRLQAVPWTRLCADCQSVVESEREAPGPMR